MNKISIVSFKLKSRELDEKLVAELQALRILFRKIAVLIRRQLFPSLNSRLVSKKYLLRNQIQKIGSFITMEFYLEVDASDELLFQLEELIEGVELSLRQYFVSIEKLHAYRTAKTVEMIVGNGIDTATEVFFSTSLLKDLMAIILKHGIGKDYEVNMKILSLKHGFCIPKFLNILSEDSDSETLIGRVQSLSFHGDHLFFMESDNNHGYSPKEINIFDRNNKALKYLFPRRSKMILLTKDQGLELRNLFQDDQTLFNSDFFLNVSTNKKFSYGFIQRVEYSVLLDYRIVQMSLKL